MQKSWCHLILILTLFALISVYSTGFFRNFLGTKSLYGKDEYRAFSLQPCTFAIFRKAYKHQRYFPRGGQWITTKGQPYYQPDLCKYPDPTASNTFILRCLAKANISRILTTGDSIGGRYAEALIKSSNLQFRLIRSEKIKGGGFIPDETYFSSEIPSHVTKIMKTKARFCQGCRSFLKRANITIHNKERSLDIEHIAQTMILDNTIDLVYPTGRGSHIPDNIWVTTTQELLFRYYLQHRYPDVYLVFLPFSHAKRQILLSRLRMEIQYFKSLIDHFIPITTKVVYIPVYAEFDDKKPLLWRNRLFENMSATDMLNEMNHVLYDVIENDLLDPTGRYYGFLDLIDVSKDRAAWNTDGVHMKPIWYERVMMMFWQTYCNSVLRDEF